MLAFETVSTANITQVDLDSIAETVPDYFEWWKKEMNCNSTPSLDEPLKVMAYTFMAKGWLERSKQC